MPLLTLPEAARIAGKPESAIRRALQTGALRSRKFGRAYAIQEKDLRDYLGGSAPAPSPAEEQGDEADWGA